MLDSGTRLAVAFGGTGARYGVSGRYDAGAYGTAVIGSVFGLGELASIERDFGPLTLRFEQGLGANSPGVGAVVATTLVAHAHVIASYGGALRAGLHYLSSWTADDRVAPEDPVTMVTAITILLVVAFGAAYLPARRASRLAPVVALRHA